MPALHILLPLLLIAVTGCLGSGPPQTGLVPLPTPDHPQARSLEQASLERINDARRAVGLEPMRVDPLLSRIALGHAEDMERRRYYAHSSPSGIGVQQRHDRAGGAEWRLVAENIARCSRCTHPPDVSDIEAFHDRWMGSAGHRANILGPGFDSFGFGFAHGADGFYLVQNFSGPGLPMGYRTGDSLEPLSSQAQAAEALDRVNAARSQAGVAALSLSPELTAAIRRVMPQPGAASFDVQNTGAVHQALPGEERNQWSGISSTYGACGGCGRAPAGADIRFFVSEWLDRPAYRSLLLDPAATHLGFAIAANGEGRKVALAAIGRAR